MNQKSILVDKILLAGVILVAVLAAILYLHYPLAYNQSLYHYQGLVMAKGGLPYTDFIEKKGPMGLLFYGLGGVFFGPSAIAYRFFDLLVICTTTILLFKSIHTNHPKWMAWIIPVIWATHTLTDGPGNTADVTNVITLCLVAAYYLLTTQPIKNSAWLVGALMGMACWVKPTAIIMFLPIWIVFYQATKEEGIAGFLKEVMKILGAAGLISVGFVSYMLLTNSLIGFWEAVVLDPVLSYVDDRSRFSLRMIKKFGKAFLVDPGFRLLGAIGFLFGMKDRETKLAAWFSMSIAMSLLVEGKFFPYHFSPLWPFMTIGLIGLLTQLSKYYKGLTDKLIRPVTFFILIIPVFIIASKFINAGFTPFQSFDQGKVFKIDAFSEMYYKRESLVAYLKKELQEDETIYIMGIDPNVYLELNHATTCRFARDAPMLTVGLANPNPPPYLLRWQEEMLRCAIDEKPDWLIIDKDLSGGELLPQYKSRLENTISADYSKVTTLGSYVVYSLGR